MPLSFFKGTQNAYEPLQTTESKSESDDGAVGLREAPYASTVLTVLLAALIALSSGALGFVLGRHPGFLSNSGDQDDFLKPSGNVNYPMMYNFTYTKEPTSESNAAWSSMFPTGVGFVKHPKHAPQLSGLAVFHELHCVNMLRIGYYAALNGNIDEMQHIHDQNSRPDPHHLRHCFDYLRQSLICAADTNLEPVDFELGGVTGWKTSRTCRDFGKVKEWAEQWHGWDPGVKKPARR